MGNAEAGLETSRNAATGRLVRQVRPSFLQPWQSSKPALFGAAARSLSPVERLI